MTNRKARNSIVLIWLSSFAVSAPLLWFRELKERKWQDYTELWCDDAWPVVTEWLPGKNVTLGYMPSRTVYFTFVSGVLYFFPIIAMAIAYSVIICKLRHSTIPGESNEASMTAQQKTKKKVIVMLVTIMSVFGICWLPYQIVLLYSELRSNRERLGEWFFLMQFLAGCFAYSNSALNPLIYAAFNENFKRGHKLRGNQNQNRRKINTKKRMPLDKREDGDGEVREHTSPNVKIDKLPHSAYRQTYLQVETLR